MFEKLMRDSQMMEASEEDIVENFLQSRDFHDHSFYFADAMTSYEFSKEQQEEILQKFSEVVRRKIGLKNKKVKKSQWLG